MPSISPRSRRLAVVTSTCLLAGAGLVACGDDDKKTTATSAASTTTPTGVGPKPTIEAWFAASKTGDAAKKCAVESLVYRLNAYPSVKDEACLTVAANTQPQPVWADTIVFTSLDVSGDKAIASSSRTRAHQMRRRSSSKTSKERGRSCPD